MCRIRARTVIAVVLAAIAGTGVAYYGHARSVDDDEGWTRNPMWNPVEPLLEAHELRIILSSYDCLATIGIKTGQLKVGLNFARDERNLVGTTVVAHEDTTIHGQQIIPAQRCLEQGHAGARVFIPEASAPLFVEGLVSYMTMSFPLKTRVEYERLVVQQ